MARGFGFDLERRVQVDADESEAADAHAEDAEQLLAPDSARS